MVRVEGSGVYVRHCKVGLKVHCWFTMGVISVVAVDRHASHRKQENLGHESRLPMSLQEGL